MAVKKDAKISSLSKVSKKTIVYEGQEVRPVMVYGINGSFKKFIAAQYVKTLLLVKNKDGTIPSWLEVKATTNLKSNKAS